MKDKTCGTAAGAGAGAGAAEARKGRAKRAELTSWRRMMETLRCGLKEDMIKEVKMMELEVDETVGWRILALLLYSMATVH